jgi:cyclase
MLQTRAIPCLLKKNSSLVKTIKFKEPQYIGDAINTIQIFNNLEADEIILLDITRTLENKPIDFDFIAKVANEAFMPFAYGGGVKSIDDMKKIFSLGVEKVIICSHAAENPSFIDDSAKHFGNQSVIVSIDIKKTLLGKYHVYTRSGTYDTKRDPVEYAKEMASRGAGEIFVNSIDNDGKMEGFDIELIKRMSNSINLPLIACGGAGSLTDIREAFLAGATAVAAGSLFVYQNINRSVLVNYPNRKELDELLQK